MRQLLVDSAPQSPELCTFLMTAPSSLYVRFGFRDAAAHHTTHMRARAAELRRVGE